jgi:hypothetical protein
MIEDFTMKKTILYSALFISILAMACAKYERLTMLKTNQPLGITATKVQASGHVIDLSDATHPSYGFYWSLTDNPENTGTKKEIPNPKTGDFSADIKSLKPGTNYYLRSYVMENQQPVLGNTISFRTLDTLASVVASEAYSVSSFTANCNATVTADGGATITERGICYAETANPTTAANKSMSGNGVGKFSVQINSLKPATKYYIRAYANNKLGTGYSNQISFSTEAAKPIINTLAGTNLAANSIDLNGELLSDQGAAISEMGFYYSTETDPKTKGTKVTINPATGKFSLSLTTLDDGVSYYFQAFATNSKGTSYGETLNFKTIQLYVPEINTLPASNLTNISATIGGNINSDGGTPISECGIIYSTLPNPMDNGTKISAANPAAGNFALNLTNLNEDTEYYYVAFAKNKKGTSYGSITNFRTVAYLKPTVSTQAAASITGKSAILNGNISSDGGTAITERGFYYGTASDPQTSGTKQISQGTQTGNFSQNIDGLTDGTDYYYIAYAQNAKGISFGSVQSFKTATYSIPTLNTLPASKVTAETATIGGNITADGGTAITGRGIIYSTSPDPISSGTKVSTTSNGTGSFNIDLSGLQDGTQYFYCAYATNAKGINYGSITNFTTVAYLKPTLSTLAAGSITGNSAILNGNISSDGGTVITERGFYYGTASDPQTSGTKQISQGMQTGNFSQSIDGLTDGTDYYYIAYAQNAKGMSFGSVQSFKTATYSIPTLNTLPASNVTAETATIGGNITADGGTAITERGIIYSTSPNPISSGTKVTATSNSTGSFSITLSGLQDGTQYFYCAYATNAKGINYGSITNFTTVAYLKPTISTLAAGSITGNSAILNGNISSDGGTAITERGFFYGTATNPQTTGTKLIMQDMGTGNFSTSVSDLKAGTMYYFVAYAATSKGIVYGTQANFKTATTLPVILTTQITSITQSTATAGGNVTSDGGLAITQRGVCFSTSQNPTTANSKIIAIGTTGEFTCNLSGLNVATKYYVRAFATNSLGTTYGSEVSFTTSPAIPTVTTATISNITQTTATCGGNVTSDGSATITERGVCYSTNPNTTIGNNKITVTGTTGTFTADLSGLTANTKYYVRAYAINSAGIGYGSESSFTTDYKSPLVITEATNNLGQTGVTLTGKVNPNGYSTNVVFEYGTTPTLGMTISATLGTLNGTELINIKTNLSGLKPSTTYFYRIKGINENGISYGETLSFTTLKATYCITISIQPIDKIVCSSSANLSAKAYDLDGNDITISSTWNWDVRSGASSIEISNSNSPSPSITGLGLGFSQFGCIVSANGCTSSATGTIENKSTKAEILTPKDQLICMSGTNLDATIPLNGETGFWQTVEGTGISNNYNLNSIQISNLSHGKNSFIWTVSNSICSSSDAINIYNNSFRINAGENQTICGSSCNLQASIPETEGNWTGNWTTASPTAVINNKYNPLTNVSSLISGFNDFTWTVTQGGCTSSDDVKIMNEIFLSVAHPSAILTTCSDQFQLKGNIPQKGWTGTWTSNGSCLFNDKNDPFSLAFLQNKNDVLKWTISHNQCSHSSEVQIINNTIKITTNELISKESNFNVVADATDAAGLNVTADVVWKWEKPTENSTIEIINSNSSNPTINGLTKGLQIVNWTVLYRDCTFKGSISIQVL